MANFLDPHFRAWCAEQDELAAEQGLPYQHVDDLADRYDEEIRTIDNQTNAEALMADMVRSIRIDRIRKRLPVPLPGEAGYSRDADIEAEQLAEEIVAREDDAQERDMRFSPLRLVVDNTHSA